MSKFLAKLMLLLGISAMLSQGVYASAMVHMPVEDRGGLSMSMDMSSHHQHGSMSQDMDEHQGNMSASDCGMTDCQCTGTSCRIQMSSQSLLNLGLPESQAPLAAKPSLYQYTRTSPPGRPPNHA